MQASWLGWLSCGYVRWLLVGGDKYGCFSRLAGCSLGWLISGLVGVSVRWSLAS